MTEIQEVVIPSSEEDRKKIRDAFVQISAAKTRVAGERDYINETIAKLAEDHNMPKRILRKMASAYHDDSFDRHAAESEIMENARILILKGE